VSTGTTALEFQFARLEGSILIRESAAAVCSDVIDLSVLLPSVSCPYVFIPDERGDAIRVCRCAADAVIRESLSCHDFGVV
jgi:hypothetical protein